MAELPSKAIGVIVGRTMMRTQPRSLFEDATECLSFVCIRMKIREFNSKKPRFAGLENRYTFGYREFESLPLREIAIMKYEKLPLS